MFSQSLEPSDYPEVTVVGEGAAARVAGLREASGKDIWLAGGGELFRSLLEANLVDTVEVGISPILLGEGRALLLQGNDPAKLRLTYEKAFPSGLLILHYEVV